VTFTTSGIPWPQLCNLLRIFFRLPNPPIVETNETRTPWRPQSVFLFYITLHM
jgi:hypothetical protein